MGAYSPFATVSPVTRRVISVCQTGPTHSMCHVRLCGGLVLALCASFSAVAASECHGDNWRRGGQWGTRGAPGVAGDGWGEQRGALGRWGGRQMGVERRAAARGEPRGDSRGRRNSTCALTQRARRLGGGAGHGPGTCSRVLGSGHGSMGPQAWSSLVVAVGLGSGTMGPHLCYQDNHVQC